MKDVRKEELIRLSMQRELTSEEESELEKSLTAHPQERTQWEEERALSRAIRFLPDVPVSSNFTSRVLQAVEMEGAREARKARSGRGWSRFLLPRLGWGMAVTVLVAVGLYYRPTVRPKPEDVLVALPIDLAKLPTPDVLADFDAINQLRQASVTTDDKLLEALQ